MEADRSPKEEPGPRAWGVMVTRDSVTRAEPVSQRCRTGACSQRPPSRALFFFLTACDFGVYYVSVLFSSSVSEFVSTLLGRKEFLLLVEPEGESSEGGAGPAEQERGEP